MNLIATNQMSNKLMPKAFSFKLWITSGFLSKKQFFKETIRFQHLHFLKIEPGI